MQRSSVGTASASVASWTGRNAGGASTAFAPETNFARREADLVIALDAAHMLKSPVSSFKTHPSESVVPEVGDLAEYRRGLVARHYATQGPVDAVHIQQHSRMVHSRSEGRFRHRRVLASRKKPAAGSRWRKCSVLVSGVVGVAARAVAIEGATIVRIGRQAEFEPVPQLRVTAG